ncbi:hypothetical protein [Caproicibacterium sp. XB2]|uniref:hypothetical protein n=1 Tax=Caproicibacterium sp. XB2 TaxID=3388458 RepID=UPI00384BCA53
MFVLSADRMTNNRQLFEQALSTAGKLVSAGRLSFSPAAWQQYLTQYWTVGCHPVHHSSIYREKEHPSYRLVQKRFVRLFPLLERMAALPKTDGTRVLAIDGRSASGKTTAASLLEQIVSASVIHMDDFFLPPQLRTDSRLSQPGGNVHYERFQKEVLPHLGLRKAFSYTAFSCQKMCLSGRRTVPESEWQIVEGAYSFHPVFGDYADLLAFSDIGPQEQMQRILKRNGSKAAQIFADRWIPLEEQYFKAFSIPQKADICF